MDDDTSGTDFSRFDNIKQMAGNKEFDAIVFKNSARLGRNQMEALRFVQYMEQCKSYDYKEIARNPEAHKGEYAKFTGEVIQVMEEYGAYTLRVNITKGDYDIWTDTILVYYLGSTDNNRILEEDIIDIYGQLGGMYTYTTVMGADNTVPLMYAEYIDIN